MPIHIDPNTPVILLTDTQLARGNALAVNSWGSGVGLPVSQTTWAGFYQRQIPRSQEPWVVDCQVSLDHWQALIWIDPALDYFKGHFPEQPILPGVVQLTWCAQLAAQCWPTATPQDAFSGSKGVKFKSPITPNQLVSLVLGYEAGKIAFSLSTTTGVCSQGTLTYRG